ncbi:FAD dependent oxidoreductase [Russula earlei]|uniref:FAD dependent oxidoreductase n=1 Tax=Russula earlei TaxID=71964 RepID=A0ACC0UBW6_9AGAM|nr:FAD dependent oxidoreductase [Russula earlei]
MTAGRNESVLIVGAGCFGISTAYHLLQRGFTNVTVLDRSEQLPAPDAASTDLNKIVRTSYSDIFYAQLARDAIQEWKKTDEWGDTYRESGVLVLGPQGGHPYASKAYENDVALRARTVRFDSAKDRDGSAALRAVFPDDVETGSSFEGAAAYLNLDSGWASAARGVEVLMARVTALGGKVVRGKGVAGLLRDPEEGGRTSGVILADGSSIVARLVVIASGSWTASTFRDLDHLVEKCISTGQTTATIQLTQEEAARYRNVPVVLDFRTGFYVFPPTDDNIIKVGCHDSGVAHHPPENGTYRPVSTPRTVSSHGDDGLRVPRSSIRSLRSSLRGVYPELAEKPFAATRLCWYTESPDSDWMIGFYPSDPGLFVATAGSGHAYKFLPVIGLIVSDALEGRLDPAIARKFAVDRKPSTLDRFDLSRGFLKPGNLGNEPLCTPEDLLPGIGKNDGGA